MKDGLYRVVTRYFVVKNNAAPILKKKLNYWITVAEWVRE